MSALSAARSRRVALASVGLAALAALGGCGRRATDAECAALLDRYVELYVRREAPRATEAELRDTQARSRERAKTNPSYQRCPKDVRERHVECAMRAPDVDEFEKCME